MNKLDSKTIKKIKSCVGNVNIKSCAKMLGLTYNQVYHHYSKKQNYYE